MTFATKALELAHQVVETQAEPVRRAAALLVASLRAGGVVNAFGSGHSEAIAMEIAGRAGGLVPSNRLTPRDLVLYGGQPPSVLTPELERDPEIAHRIYELAPVAPQDVFVLISSSGINGAVVELATLVKDRGHPLIALTSVQHSSQMTSRHPSGSKLLDLADVVLDNGAPYGDAILELPGGGGYGAISTVTSALLAQMVVTEAVAVLVALGETPPIYLSVNVAGGDEHNKALESRYAGRIRRGA
ncbi:sugar isomerase domain-containing protein [Nonomuraea aurantiaca]|uniref:sugar isomerase domain-containing protein n=1 Tax=Nonomuraea aurantiaca TaxID=2878562 RepID=UPI001CD9225D|nr:SIS domain-containing protein [Nonomuraea aurantiaca]MCA2227269.1 SIS domain-containing protein [Nonomuraea aurantiaca]